MRTITFEVPDHISRPESIADYAFALTMDAEFGTIENVCDFTDDHERINFEHAANAVCNYLEGVSGHNCTDPYSVVLEYVHVAHPTDECTWLAFISDMRDA